MASDTGLMSSLTKEQESAISNILTKHKKKNNATNESLVALQIVAYCNIYGGKAGSHEEDPIDGIPGLQD